MHAADVVIDITEVDTSAMYPLGQEFFAPATSQATITTSKPVANTGSRTWVYTYNDEASTAWAAGNVIARDVSTEGTDYAGILAPVDSNPIRIMGIAQHAIAFGSYGWILKRGQGVIKAGSETIDKDEVVAVSAATTGCGMESSTIAIDAHEASAIGWALADAASAATALCWINCRG